MRNLLSAYSKLIGEDAARQKLRESDLALIEGDTFEQQVRDADVEERWRRVHGPGKEEISGVASRVRQKLRDMTRVTVRSPE